MVKNLPVVQEIQVQCLSQKDPWRREWLLRAKGRGPGQNLVLAEQGELFGMKRSNESGTSLRPDNDNLIGFPSPSVHIISTELFI